MTTPATNADVTKRTRTNVKQSKYGCFTCKARRVKCDEAKPACRRCLTANRSCQGYPRGAPTGPPPGTVSAVSLSSLPSTLLQKASSTPFTIHPTYVSSPFANLACDLLVRSPRRGRSDEEIGFWSHIVPQLTQFIPSIQAAAEAFGASYKEFALGQTPVHTGIETAKRYSRALRLVQDDLSTMQYGPMSAIIACLFLASAEALQQQLEKGQSHLLGAFSLLKYHTSNKVLSLATDMDGVSLLLYKLDLHISTYSTWNAPTLPPLGSLTSDALASDRPDETLVRVLHSCYRFASDAFSYKYTSRRLIPAEFLIEQGRHIGILKQWLMFNELPPGWETDTEMRRGSLPVLRSQCLAALILTANILDPREMSYDCYGPDFQEIISLMETHLSDNSHMDTAHRDNLIERPSFNLEMGIIHPLYFTALKYRNSFWRRKALKLLLRSGKEGPWCGQTEGSVVSIVIKAEEGLLENATPHTGGFEDCIAQETFNISERCRVNACWPIDPAPEDEAWMSGSRKRFTKALIFRCIDLEGLLQYQGPQPTSFPPESPEHLWEQWREPLEAVR